MPVMRKPDRTKNSSTPYDPYLVTPTTALSIQLVGRVSPTKWSSRTIRMANPRTPSSTGTCTLRFSNGLDISGRGAPGIAAPGALRGKDRCASTDIGSSVSALARSCNTGQGAGFRNVDGRFHRDRSNNENV